MQGQFGALSTFQHKEKLLMEGVKRFMLELKNYSQFYKVGSWINRSQQTVINSENQQSRFNSVEDIQDARIN